MKKDILAREDIEHLIGTFYESVKEDETIGYFFTEVMNTDWDKHMPVMVDFWENILFHTGTYSGNPMIQHIKLNERSKMERKHFERWMELFAGTVDKLFEGNNAEQIKQRALSIATVMQIKIIG